MSSSPILTVALLLVYAFVLLRRNRGSVLRSPAGIHFAYLTLYVIVPVLILHEVGAPVRAGRGRPFFIEDSCLLALDIALLGLTLGCMLARKPAEGRAPKQLNPVDDLSAAPRRWTLGFLSGLSLLLPLIFAAKNFESLVTLVSFSSLFDPDRYSEIQGFKTDALYGANYLLQGLNHIIPFVALFLLAQSYRLRTRRERAWASSLIVFDVLILFATGALWVAFATVLMAVMVRNYFKTPTRKDAVASVAALVLLVLVSYALKRGATSLEEKPDDQTPAIVGLLGERFSAGARQLQFVLDTFPNPAPYEYGLTYLRDGIGMIPSPVKRLFFREEYWGGYNGYLFYWMYGYFGGTAQIPLIGEFYSNFGSFGVFAGSMVYAYWLQRISDRLRWRNLRNLSSVVFLVTIGYRMAEATVEGLGDRLMVSLLWTAIIYVLFFYLDLPLPDRPASAAIAG